MRRSVPAVKLNFAMRIALAFYEWMRERERPKLVRRNTRLSILTHLPALYCFRTIELLARFLRAVSNPVLAIPFLERTRPNQPRLLSGMA
jgi:hypothetical protein